MRCVSLLYIFKQEVRLLALVVAKNAVGSNWSKQVQTREWKKVPGMYMSAHVVVLMVHHPALCL